MDNKNLFEKFDEEGKLLMPNETVSFDSIPWCKHSAFEGVELKHINLHSAAFQLAAQIVMKVFHPSTLCCRIVSKKLHYKAR